MVIKKPFAIFIKLFKVFHLVLFLLLSFICYKVFNIFSFYNDYVNNSFHAYFENYNSHFFGFLFFFSLFFVFVLTLLILIVLIKKKKNYYLYLIQFAYFLLLLIFSVYNMNIFMDYNKVKLSIQAIRALRDIWIIFSFPILIFIIINLIRGLGFNIRNFNFKKDLEDLKIDEKDNEEIEIKLDDTYKYAKGIRKTYREFKYYIKENKVFVYITISIVILIVLGFALYVIIDNSRKYVKYTVFNVNGIKYTIYESFETKLDYNGNEIDKDKKYILVRCSLENLNKKSTKLTSGDIQLVGSDNSQYYYKTATSDFKDLGTIYNNDLIKYGENKEYLLAFEVKDNNTRKYELKIGYLEYSNGNTKYKYNVVKLSPEDLDDDLKNSSYNTKTLISVKENVFEIENYFLKSEFNEPYKYSISDVEYEAIDVIKPSIYGQDSNLILKIKFSNYNNDDINLLFNDYAYLNYYENNKLKRVKLTSISKVNHDALYFEVPKEANNSQIIELLLKVRNNNYYINLK